MSARFQPPFGWAATIFATIAVIAALVAVPMSAGARSAGHGALHHVKARASLLTPCTLSFCQFPIQVNPALLSGPLDCPAIHNAAGTITITNRFRATGRNDDMMIDVTGLPPSRGFDLFLVEHTPLDAGQFNGFGFAWYQSDLASDAKGSAAITVRGIFDREVFIENPANPNVPIHTFNVGFWFDTPAAQKAACGYATAPAPTPFNPTHNAGTLAMITANEPLQAVQ